MDTSGLEQYFELSEEDNCVRFLGEKLECYIPERYTSLNLLEVGATVKTLGIFKMVIDDDITCGLQLPCVIEIDPADVSKITDGQEKYYLCTLNKGGQLITSLDLLQNAKIGYLTWREFMSVDHMPDYVNYENVAFLFDDLKECTGKGIAADHAILEIIFAHIFRDAKDPNVFYRHTNMKEKPYKITLTSISYGTSGTFSKIAGSYAQQGYNSAMLNPAEENTELEDLFRR